jgi:hypothetical protein
MKAKGSLHSRKGTLPESTVCSVDKYSELISKFLEHIFKPKEFRKKGLMFLVPFLWKFVCLELYLFFVELDLLLQIVNVDELDVKLIIKMFNLLIIVFGEGFPAGFLEKAFAVLKFVFIATEDLPPFRTLCGKL